MTPAIDLLKRLNINFSVHQFEHDSNTSQFGQEALTKLSPKLAITKGQVFKTLVVSLNGHVRSLAVCVLPVDCYLDLKKAANALKSKKIDLADVNIAEKTTGYLIGGISPLGQKKQLPTLIDNNAKLFETIFISGGRRGLEIELSPYDLADVIQAEFVDIIS